MSAITFLEVSDDFHDVLLRMTFEVPLQPTETIMLLDVVLNVLSPWLLPRLLCEGLVNIEINETGLRLLLRFRRTESLIKSLSPDARDNLTRMTAQFLFHLAAVIDNAHTIIGDSFPPGFRDFLNWEYTTAD